MARLWFMDRAKYGRSCRDCRTYQYDESTGRPHEDRRKSHAGRLMMRSKNADPPCYDCAKTIGLARRHWREREKAGGDVPDWCYRTFRHWREGKAVGFRGSDPAGRVDRIVRRNADLFQTVEDTQAAGRADGLILALGLRRAQG